MSQLYFSFRFITVFVNAGFFIIIGAGIALIEELIPTSSPASSIIFKVFEIIIRKAMDKIYL